MTDDAKVRDRGQVVELLRRSLIGPLHGPEESLKDKPNLFYAMGVLYPQETASSVLDEHDPEDGAVGSVGDELPDDPVPTHNSWMPSSLGLSLYLSGGARLEVSVHGAAYEERDGRWHRLALSESTPVEPVVLTEHEPEAPALGGRARLRSVWRTLGDGRLVTVTLANVVQRPVGGDPAPQDCLYQVGFTVAPDGADIAEYPQVQNLSRDEEEQELRLAYRHKRIYAVGHNCSVDWRDEASPDGSPRTVRTEFLPTAVVPAVTADAVAERRATSIAWLADEDRDTAELQAALREFVADYTAWIDGQRSGAVPRHLEAAKGRLVDRQERAAHRMLEGIEALSDEGVRKAFTLANLAMLMQMRHAHADLGGATRRRDEASHPEIDYLDLEYRWRPFQLAFQLLVLPSLIDQESTERDVVDLLWFPTGGGKTEAYLGLTAFTVFLRRLRHGAAGTGTAVITRYTLRLLTTQQFQRAATLICACERIRAGRGDLGTDEISLGLWLGDDVTPNQFTGPKGAKGKAEALLATKDPKGDYPFQLDRCPWCGTEIVPETKTSDLSAYGVSVENGHLELSCPSPGCHFQSRLPVLVVDDEIYRTPPSFLVSTVDKFARLAWLEQAGRIFGTAGGVLPPSMIIQDELHLLSGPLGTTVGVYEAAVDTLIGLNGPPAKVIASTATIRRASDQIQGLYGRGVELFPPSGTDADDSFFARVDRTRPGRLYAGVMTPARTTAMAVRLTASPLLAAPIELPLDPDLADSMWTVVVYHNSLRELGRTITIARDDIPAHLEAIASDPGRVRGITDQDVVELTSNVPARELPVILRRMETPGGAPDAVSVLACTNMLSVGVDVPRLSVMLVNGQPKTASEYIQATSRVGRGDVPGLVVTLLSATKPRDRSHYEGFVAFHQALYRNVEPTSVTPYSLPSRRRALHAALVIAVRHGAGLTGNAQAQEFDATAPEIRKAVAMLADRVAAGDPSEATAAREHLERLVNEWHERAEEAEQLGPPLRYHGTGKQFGSLLVDFQSEWTGWETLHSMRSVDLQVAVDV